jgi:hypothetical protein
LKCFFIRAQPTWALIDTGEGYHIEALNIRSDHSPTFPSSIQILAQLGNMFIISQTTYMQKLR